MPRCYPSSTEACEVIVVINAVNNGDLRPLGNHQGFRVLLRLCLPYMLVWIVEQAYYRME